MPLTTPFFPQSPEINGFSLPDGVFVGSSSISGQSLVPFSIASTMGGRTVLVLDLIQNVVLEFRLSSCNANTLVFTGITLSLAPSGAFSVGMSVSPDERRLYITNFVSTEVHQYNLTNKGSISNAVFSGNSLFVGAQTAAPQGLTVGGDGEHLFVAGAGVNAVYRYTLGNTSDVSTGLFVDSLDVSGTSTGSFLGLGINRAGTALFTSTAATRVVSQYFLPTPFTLSTGVVSSVSFDGAPFAPLPSNNNAFCFSGPDGKYLFMVDFTNDTVFQFSTHNLLDRCNP